MTADDENRPRTAADYMDMIRNGRPCVVLPMDGREWWVEAGSQTVVYCGRHEMTLERGEWAHATGGKLVFYRDVGPPRPGSTICVHERRTVHRWRRFGDKLAGMLLHALAIVAIIMGTTACVLAWQWRPR